MIYPYTAQAGPLGSSLLSPATQPPNHRTTRRSPLLSPATQPPNHRTTRPRHPPAACCQRARTQKGITILRLAESINLKSRRFQAPPSSKHTHTHTHTHTTTHTHTHTQREGGRERKRTSLVRWLEWVGLDDTHRLMRRTVRLGSRRTLTLRTGLQPEGEKKKKKRERETERERERGREREREEKRVGLVSCVI